MGPTEDHGRDYKEPGRPVDLLDAFRLADRRLQEALHGRCGDGEDDDLCLVRSGEEVDSLEVVGMGSAGQVFGLG